MKVNTEEVEELLMRAGDMLSAGEFAAPFAISLPLAEQGDMTAQFQVGFFFAGSYNRMPARLGAAEWEAWYDEVYQYHWPEWIVADETEALRWFILSAEQGDPEAVLQARILSERLHCDLPWKEATGKRRELLDLAEQQGYFVVGLIYQDASAENLSHREYLRKYMGNPAKP